MLCKFCSSIDFDLAFHPPSSNANMKFEPRNSTPTGTGIYKYHYKHHDCFEDVQKSALDGCELCRRLVNEVESAGSTWVKASGVSAVWAEIFCALYRPSTAETVTVGHENYRGNCEIRFFQSLSDSGDSDDSECDIHKGSEYSSEQGSEVDAISNHSNGLNQQDGSEFEDTISNLPVKIGQQEDSRSDTISNPSIELALAQQDLALQSKVLGICLGVFADAGKSKEA
jgi:hypothetical protein